MAPHAMSASVQHVRTSFGGLDVLVPRFYQKLALWTKPGDEIRFLYPVEFRLVATPGLNRHIGPTTALNHIR